MSRRYQPTLHRPDGWDKHDAPDPVNPTKHPAADLNADIPPWAQTARQDNFDRSIYGDPK